MKRRRRKKKRKKNHSMRSAFSSSLVSVFLRFSFFLLYLLKVNDSTALDTILSHISLSTDSPPFYFFLSPFAHAHLSSVS